MPMSQPDEKLSSSDFDAIIFDNDGVLVDSERIHVAVELELLKELGLDYSYGEYLSRFVGLSTPDFHAALSHDFEAKYDKPFPDTFSDDLHKRVWPRMEAELEPLPGISDLVERAGKPVAVASSASADRLNRKLVLTNLHDLFDPHIYSSQRVQNGKPAPDLFLFAAAQLGIPPQRCAVIEDSVNGVRAGRAAGMIVVGFIGGGHADERLGERLRDAGAHLISARHDTLLKP